MRISNHVEVYLAPFKGWKIMIALLFLNVFFQLSNKEDNKPTLNK